MSFAFPARNFHKNTNFKFHKVVDTHYLCKVENIYSTMYSVANIFRTISAKFYQNRPGFVDDVTKTFGVFGFAVPIAVHFQNVNAKFYKVV